jgi:hypothetical protein
MDQRRVLIIDQKLVIGNLVSWKEARYSVYAVIYFRNINFNIFNTIEGSANFFRQSSSYLEDRGYKEFHLKLHVSDPSNTLTI